MTLPEEKRDPERETARARHELRATHEPPAGMPGRLGGLRTGWGFALLVLIVLALCAWIIWWQIG